ncbi:hypothetical protein ACIGCZ_13470 [Streptomyces nigra]|uniref:hypothetical protein n=1 Tax=Streptomyces nigra TaxID=1827580 RepID=UPI0036657C5D
MDSTDVVRWKATGTVRSLMWDGDDLVDRVDGGRRWTSDGAEHQSRTGTDRADRARRQGLLPPGSWADAEIDAACWLDGSRLAVAEPDGIAIIGLPRSASCPSPKEASSR